MRLLNTALAASVAAILLSVSPALLLASETENRWAIIFAPGEYASLSNSPQHARGAERLRRQLLKSGFDAEQIRLLSSISDADQDQPSADNFRTVLQEVTNQVQQDDVFVVAILSHGVHAEGTTRLGSASAGLDYVASKETSLLDCQTVRQAGTNDAAKSLVSMQEVVETMSTAASNRQLLLVDGSPGSSMTFSSDHTAAFGTGRLLLRTGQYAVMNRNASSKKGVTRFSCSVCDGLTEFADGDENEFVSREELVEYVQRYFDTFDLLPLPVVRGNVTEDFELATAVGPEGDGAFTRDIRDQMARTLVQSARHLMLIAGDMKAAQEVLERAIAYRPSAGIRSEISCMLLTLLAAQIGVDDAWGEAESLKQPLFVVATGEFEVRTGKEVLNVVKPAELILFDLRQGNWLHPKKRFETTFHDGVISFRQLETRSGWAHLHEIQAAPSANQSQSDKHSLVRILRQLNGQPSTRNQSANRQVSMQR